jgi:hypothetical protein
MQFIDKDMMKVKLEIEGTTYYFGNTRALQRGLEDGGWALIRNANYIVENGKFTKNRSSGDELPNAILALGRDKINALFDFFEKN